MISFPTAIPSLLHSDTMGRVENILVRPTRKEPAQTVEEWDPSGNADHGNPNSKRAVTLIQKEHLDVVAALSGNDIKWELTRRNVLVSGINLQSLIGHRFRIGDAIFEGTCLVDPCKNMEAAMGPGTYAAMMGHGGIGAKIIGKGSIRVGDNIQWLGTNQPEED